MYRIYKIKYVKVEYKRGKKAVYLDMKKYISKRVWVYEDKWKIKFEFGLNLC